MFHGPQVGLRLLSPAPQVQPSLLSRGPPHPPSPDSRLPCPCRRLLDLVMRQAVRVNEEDRQLSSLSGCLSPLALMLLRVQEVGPD